MIKTAHRVNHLGPFIMAERDNNYVIPIICEFCKYTDLWAVNLTSAKKCMLFMKEFIVRYEKLRIHREKMLLNQRHFFPKACVLLIHINILQDQ